MHRLIKFRLVVAIVGAVALAPSSAHAYIDPGTGSMLLQGLIAGIAAGLVVIKLYWYKVKMFLFGRGQKDNSPADNVPDEDDGR